MQKVYSQWFKQTTSTFIPDCFMLTKERAQEIGDAVTAAFQEWMQSEDKSAQTWFASSFEKADIKTPSELGLVMFCIGQVFAKILSDDDLEHKMREAIGGLEAVAKLARSLSGDSQSPEENELDKLLREAGKKPDVIN